ncbi:uncharacterized protein LOC125026563 [Penaeus chinensis]|uniref:uncharacterized protein LOC125026563 n=1 Tax=Penaeus chinensis TaxID=139456 RepID=UPI001FB683FB|nr:uncharacterized protein LOC125026563 [Penaeus chinensis]XP_047471036.1 uncharacterized protein LOC125026563 [Penaeus chinensis]
MGGPGGRVGTGRRTMAPGQGGQVARNLEESQVVEARDAQDTRTVTERVWQHLASVPCQDHQHTDPVIVPQTSSTWTPHKEAVPGSVAYVTTGGDYGRFPRGSEALGRPPVNHSLSTRFTHHLAASGMFRNHSLNL